jgi:signal recognition particle receptor subunit beta
VNGIQVLCQLALKSPDEYKFDSEENKRLAQEMTNLSAVFDSSSEWPKICVNSRKLWQDSAIQKAYRNRNECNIEENVNFFFENLERIAAVDYKPTLVDMIMTRVKTLGVTEKKIIVDETTSLALVDVGGQRAERKRWHNLFETTLCVLYLVSLSDYNQKLYEDEEGNRMQENFQLFTHTVNNPKLKEKPVIILFNKLDVFKDKLQQGKDSIKLAFGDYNGQPDSVEESIQFLENKFRNARDGTQAKTYTFTVTAIDTDNLRNVFNEIKKIAAQHMN